MLLFHNILKKKC